MATHSFHRTMTGLLTLAHSYQTLREIFIGITAVPAACGLGCSAYAPYYIGASVLLFTLGCHYFARGLRRYRCCQSMCTLLLLERI